MTTIIVKATSGLQELINRFQEKIGIPMEEVISRFHKKVAASREEVLRIAQYKCAHPAVETFKTQALLAYTFDLPLKLIPEINKNNIHGNCLFPFNKKTSEIRSIPLHPLILEIIESYDEMPCFDIDKALKQRKLFYKEPGTRKEVYRYDAEATKVLQQLPFDLSRLDEGSFFHMCKCGLAPDDYRLLTGRTIIALENRKYYEDIMERLYANPFFDHLKYLIA